MSRTVAGAKSAVPINTIRIQNGLAHGCITLWPAQEVVSGHWSGHHCQGLKTQFYYACIIAAIIV